MAPAPADDVRTVVRATLGWNFSFACSDARATRCLVPHPDDATRLADWFVRTLPSPSSSTCTTSPPTSRPTRRKVHDHVPVADNLEAVLATELRLGRGDKTWTKEASELDDERERPLAEFSSVLDRLYTDIPVYTDATDRATLTRSMFETHATARSLHVPTLRGVYVSTNGTTLAVFAYNPQSCQDVRTYNPTVLEGASEQAAEPARASTGVHDDARSDLKKRLVVAQLYHVLAFLHDRGCACNGFLPSQVHLSDTLWLELGAVPHVYDPDDDDGRTTPTVQLPRPVSSSHSSTERWIQGDMSNLEYLMTLNAAAGRRLESSVFHPILPWVTTFENGPHAGWRDLRQSKFRLTKGDAQLDRTFATSLVPHHIPESLSELTYYIYLARRTPMSVLQRLVRTHFQAREYPSTMTRLFAWTPDECIPAFYTDATVFTSLHGTDTMAHLDVPDWGQPEDDHDARCVAFVRRHRAMLESDEVSRALHHWIDLNFGAALSGERAMREKNVPLVVPGADKSPGFVQLFTHAHPPWQGRPAADDHRASTKRTVLDARVVRPRGTTREVNAMLSRATQVVTEAHATDAAVGLASSSRQGQRTGSSSALRPCPTDVFESARDFVSPPTSARDFVSTPSLKLSASSSTCSTEATTRSHVLMRTLKPRRRGHKAQTRAVQEPPTSPSSMDARDVLSPPSSSSLSASRLGTIFHTEVSKGSSGVFSSAPDASMSPASSRGPVQGPGNGTTTAPNSGPTEYVRLLTITTPPGETPGPSFSSSSTRYARQLSVGSASPSPGAHLFRDLWQQFRPLDDESAPSGHTTLGASHTRYPSGSHDLLHDGTLSDPLDDAGDAVVGTLDDLDVQLLQLSLPIVLPSEQATEWHDDTDAGRTVRPECASRVCFMDDDRVDPVYHVPDAFVRTRASDLTPFERARAADLFSMGCLVAELYMHKPVFSRRSMHDYVAAYTSAYTEQATTEANDDRDWIARLVATMPDRRPPRAAWRDALAARLGTMPLNLKQAVLAMLHPDVSDRLRRTRDVLDALGLARASERPSVTLCHPPDDAFYAAPAALVPRELERVYTFLAHVHSVSDPTQWDARFSIVRTHLPSLASISDTSFRVVLPELVQFFRPTSHTETIRADRVVAAVLFLLPEMARHVGRRDARTEFLSDIVRVYERSDLSHSCFLRCCLGAPSVLLALVRAFGPTVVLEQFVPVMLEWLQPPTRADESAATPSSLPFAAESAALTAVTFGALSSSAMLGPALSIKYLFPLVLTQLGRVKSRWTHLADSKTLKCTDKRVSPVPPAMLDDTHVPRAAEFHITFLSKTKLYDAHHVADAALQMCRELGDVALVELLLPRLFDALPRLILLSEKIGSVRIDGVPDELGREIYVLLRLFRHVLRSMKDPNSLHDVLSRGARGTLMDLLALVSPPFLPPRVATAVIAAATTPAVVVSAPVVPSSTRTTVSATKKKVLRSLHFIKDADHHHLRAFTAVGLARTILAVCQKLGPDVTVADATVVHGIHRFLKQCSDVYAELEVSNFQWHLASELVGEWCVPLRTLVGKELFARHFGIVGSSSVLQLLLLPLKTTPCTTAGRTGHDHGPAIVSALDDRLASARSREARDDDDDDDEAEKQEKQDAGVASRLERDDAQTYLPDLVRFAYHAVRLHAIRTTSFLCFPTTVLLGTDKPPAEWETALTHEMLRLQDARRLQKLENAAVALERGGADAIWLRPRIVQPLDDRGDNNRTRAYETTDTVSTNLGRSWALGAEIRQSIKAHSSAIRCLSVDDDEEMLLTGTRQGSCRVWRLARHPVQVCTTAPPSVCTNFPILGLARAGRTEPCVRSLETGARACDGLAVAAAASGVMLWDVRTSQVRLQVPFAATTEPLVAMTTGAWGLEVAVASTRRVVCLDVRTGPRVAAEWYADGAGIHALTATGFPGASVSAVSTFHDGTHYLVVGTTSGRVVLLDARTGRHVLQWQALDGPSARIVQVVQISSSQVLVIGSDKEARVYRLMLRRQVHPQLRMTITGAPDGLTAAQIALHATRETSVLYIVSGARLYCTHLPLEPRAVVSVQTPVTRRMEAWQVMDAVTGGKASKSRLVGHGLAVLPLRQLVLVGADDGCIKCLI